MLAKRFLYFSSILLVFIALFSCRLYKITGPDYITDFPVKNTVEYFPFAEDLSEHSDASKYPVIVEDRGKVIRVARGEPTGFSLGNCQSWWMRGNPLGQVPTLLLLLRHPGVFRPGTSCLPVPT